MSRRRLVALLLVAMLPASCASDEADGVVVDMFDNRFSPAELTIEAGTEITFRGAGRNPHNAVASDGSWSTESVFNSLDQYEGDDAVLRFETPGTYDFFCTYHGTAEGQGMAGTITVEDSR